MRAVTQVKLAGRITNLDYQQLTGTNRKTAARDLNGLVEKGVLVRQGEKRGTFYLLARGKP